MCGGVFGAQRMGAQATRLTQEKQYPHCLKHSIAVHLVAANVNLAMVKQTIGHASINSTMRYVAVTDAQAGSATHSALMGLF